VDGVQELDGVHGDLRSEAKCTGKILGSAGETGEASRLFSWAGRNSPASPVVSGRSAEIGDRVTEWPESSLLVEATETYEAEGVAICFHQETGELELLRSSRWSLSLYWVLAKRRSLPPKLRKAGSKHSQVTVHRAPCSRANRVTRSRRPATRNPATSNRNLVISSRNRATHSPVTRSAAGLHAARADRCHAASCGDRHRRHEPEPSGRALQLRRAMSHPSLQCDRGQMFVALPGAG